MFLMRYFGIIAIIITGVVTSGYILLFWLFEKYHTDDIKKRIVRLITTNLVSAVFMVAYWGFNKIKTGKISGVDRLKWTDDYLDLTDNLYHALSDEFFNASRIQVFDVIEQMNSNLLAIIILIVMFFLVGICVFQFKKGIDYRTVFIGVGVLYSLLFIGVRYYSYMDPFGSRFFAPGTMLIALGIFGYIEEKLGEWNFEISFFLSTLLVVFIISLIIRISEYHPSNTAYELARSEITAELSDIPAKSAVFLYDGNKNVARVMRPDIMFYQNEIDTTKDLNDWIDRYSNYEFICIKQSVLKESILNQNSSESFLKLLAYMDGEQGNNNYVIIYVEDGCVKLTL